MVALRKMLQGAGRGSTDLTNKEIFKTLKTNILDKALIMRSSSAEVIADDAIHVRSITISGCVLIKQYCRASISVSRRSSSTRPSDSPGPNWKHRS